MNVGDLIRLFPQWTEAEVNALKNTNVSEDEMFARLSERQMDSATLARVLSDSPPTLHSVSNAASPILSTPVLAPLPPIPPLDVAFRPPSSIEDEGRPIRRRRRSDDKRTPLLSDC